MIPNVNRGVSAVRARNSTFPIRWPSPGAMTIGTLTTPGTLPARATGGATRSRSRWAKVEAMDVAIAGGHGQIARRLASLLAARGDTVRGLIRNPGHAAAVHASGADPVVCDLEQSASSAVAEAIEGADAVVFAAGAGPGSGSARKLTMDRDGAVK